MNREPDLVRVIRQVVLAQALRGTKMDNQFTWSGLSTKTVTRGLVAVGILIANVPLYAAPARYDYSGGPHFTQIQNNNPAATYDTSMGVSGFIVFADTLAPDTSYNVNGGTLVLPPSILDWSFSDGVQTLTPSNSILPFLAIHTSNDTSLFSNWNISVHRLAGPNESTTPGAISTNFSPGNNGNLQEGGQVVDSTSPGCSPFCQSFGSVIQFANGDAASLTPGAWTLHPVPLPAAIWLLGSAIGISLGMRRRFPTPEQLL
jgi:hypothetical protein